MNMTLYSFPEAFDKLVKGEMKYMIRASEMKADFRHKIILLHKSTRYYLDKKSTGFRVVCCYTENGTLVSEVAKIHSDDLLACDYIDSNEWKLLNNASEYEEYLKGVINSGTKTS